MKVKTKWYLGLSFAAVLLLGFGVGGGYYWGFNHEQAVLAQKFNDIKPLRAAVPGDAFIDPLLFYTIPSNTEQWGLDPMKSQVQSVISNAENNDGVTDASVFFQDLNKGRWLGINQNDEYNPASMLKVVIMIAYYKEAEDNPSLLYQTLTYTSSESQEVLADPYNQSSGLTVGDSYSVDSLINKMIVNSDNGAAEVLLGNISESLLDEVYDVLDIPNPDDTTGTFTISPRYYSFFFRILYSATYLNDAYSEKALETLSEATFKNGIVAALPASVDVSHKYGEYVTQSNGVVSQVELHDCGIVYYPKDPYLLCVMTKGNNLGNLETVIKSISQAVYQNYASTH
jgi:beta-lactamase class A